MSEILKTFKDVRDKKLVVAYSGGLDSSTLLYNLLKYGASEVHPVFFNYGQRHLKQEFRSAKLISYFYSKKALKKIKIDLSFLESSSLITQELEIDEGKNNKSPNSFVAGRNILFLTYLASLGYELFDKNEDIIIGIANHFDDFNGYPDCRMNTLESLQETLSLGLGKNIKIFAPFTKMTKSDIVTQSSDFILKNSWSCYEGLEKPCGTCKSCILKNEAISNNLKKI